MPVYRVEFIREWIIGRWGFTDRVFHELSGRVTEPSRLEEAWLVTFTGKPEALGRRLQEMLNIQPADWRRFGPIFEITEVAAEAAEPEPPPRQRAPTGRRR